MNYFGRREIGTDIKEWVGARHVRLGPKAAFQRAIELQAHGNLAEAEAIYRAILKHNRDDFGSLYNLASVLIAAQRFEEATETLRKVLRQKPNSVGANTMLAYALNGLGRHAEALDRARRAVALNADAADASVGLFSVFTSLGHYDEARQLAAQAIDYAPDRPLFYYQWGYISRWSADDPRLPRLEALSAKSQAFSIDDQARLNFTLAKAYADIGDHERAFRSQIAGAALQRQVVKYDEAASLRQLDELCRTWSAAWLAQHAGAGNPSLLPIFILGMPRSGSTLVEQVLASHPEVHGLGERPTLYNVICHVGGIQPSSDLLPGDIAAAWSDADIRRLGDLYAQATRGIAPGAERSIDKQLSNFRFIGLIRAVLPNARIIHVRRDPLDTCLSIFSLLFDGASIPYSYDLGELGRYYRAYQKMMAHWHSVLPPGVMIDVQYEEVVDDFEAQARRIVAHCGLDWDDACLEFYKTDRPVATASHAQVRQPIYRTSVGRPRPPRELLLPLLQALGMDDAAGAA